MISFIETLNQWGGNFLSFAWPMLWQSSLLIAGLFTLEFLFRRRLRASIRYALWLVVLVKLCVPPTLALPTSPAWWLHQTPSPVVAKPAPHYTVTYDDAPMQPYIAPPTVAMPAPPLPRLELAGWALAGSMTVSVGLLLWLALRWWQVARMVRRATATEQFSETLDDVLRLTGVPNARPTSVRLKIVEGRMSPAVCGLFRPVILLPRSLAEKLSAEQLRAVLLHELIHLHRRDVWVNFLQALLQIFYWWHPLLWVANARIRRVREEAVDDAVMLALRDDADHYAPTLLEVAKLALNRPLVSLGLVGIMESRHALRQRIERLVDFHSPRHAGLTLVSLLGILAFTAVAVPMGEKPSPVEKETAPAALNMNVSTTAVAGIITNPNFRTVLRAMEQRSTNEVLGEPEVVTTNGRHAQMRAQNLVENVVAQTSQPLGVASKTNLPMVLITAEIYQMRAAEFEKVVERMDSVNVTGGKSFIGTVAADHLTAVQDKIKSLGLKPFSRPRIKTSHGKPANFFNGYVVVGYATNGVEFDSLPLVGDQLVELAFSLNILGDRLAKDGTNLIGKAKHTVNGRVTAENHGGIVACADNPNGSVKTKFVALVSVEILTNNPPPQFQQRLNTIIHRADDTNFVAGANATNLFFTRTFKVDTRSFTASLKQAGAELDDRTNSAAAVSAAVRKFFTRLGVDLESPPGKTVFFNDRNGLLFVRSTVTDLNTIEQAIQILNTVEPQIHIKTRFVEVPKGTVADFAILLNASNAVAESFSGVLNPANARKVCHSLTARNNSEIWGEPEITTTSGRQCQMRATQVITVVTNFAYQESITNNASAVVPQTGTFETGPVVDLVPHVMADGYTINLTVTTSLTEFWGYANPPDVPNVVRDQNRVQLPFVLPHFNKRQVTANLNLWDGQTAVLGGMSVKNIIKDQTPLLGSVPLMGRMFRSLHTNETEILVFVTATIVDPAGNRVHADDDLPFAQKGIPPQPSPAK